jgi:hypothetical protein
MKTNILCFLVLLVTFGCKNTVSGYEQSAVISKTFAAKSGEPLALFSRNLHERFSESDGYQIRSTRDYDYKGEYLEFSRNGKAILEVMKVPIEGNDYTISIYATDFLGQKDESDLYQIVSSDLVEIDRSLNP